MAFAKGVVDLDDDGAQAPPSGAVAVPEAHRLEGDSPAPAGSSAARPRRWRRSMPSRFAAVRPATARHWRGRRHGRVEKAQQAARRLWASCAGCRRGAGCAAAASGSRSGRQRRCVPGAAACGAPGRSRSVAAAAVLMRVPRRGSCRERNFTGHFDQQLPRPRPGRTSGRLRGSHSPSRRRRSKCAGAPCKLRQHPLRTDGRQVEHRVRVVVLAHDVRTGRSRAPG
jgi:hypothetical protein